MYKKVCANLCKPVVKKKRTTDYADLHRLKPKGQKKPCKSLVKITQSLER